MRKAIHRQEDKEKGRRVDRRKRSRVLIFLVSLSLNLLVFFSVASAQSGRKPKEQSGRSGQSGQSGQKGQPGQQQGENPILRIETREVALPIIAYDAEGNYVNDLAPKDVLVLEEGESRQVTNLKRDPANIVLILDLANEIGTFKNGPTERYGKPEAPVWETGANYKVIRGPTQWEFANQFISGISPSDRIAIIQYAEKPQLIQDWTSDRDQAARAISSKYRAGLKSSYYDALKLAADKLQSSTEGRRIVVLISDGLDSNSKITHTKALQALDQSRATVFVVGWSAALRHEIELNIGWINAHETNTTNSMKRKAELRKYVSEMEGAATELRQLAENSGGELLLPPTHNDLIKANKDINAEIGAQYTLSFLTEKTPSLDDKREIEVLPARQGLTVRSRHSFQLDDEDVKARGQ